ncbi:MAG: hypothetical protein ACREAB_07260 [Blastocatellia bacterium]
METWEVLEEAIPRGEAERIAKIMRVSANLVRRWCRQPESDDNNATGRFNPLEELMLLFDALNARHPEGVDLIFDYIASEVAAARRIRDQKNPISGAEAESELRAAARRLEQVADMIAGTSADGSERV